jgi:hypothetical protein
MQYLTLCRTSAGLYRYRPAFGQLYVTKREFHAIIAISKDRWINVKKQVKCKMNGLAPRCRLIFSKIC